MISDYQDREAVDKWFTARVKVIVGAIGALGGLAMVTASIITIAGHFG